MWALKLVHNDSYYRLWAITISSTATLDGPESKCKAKYLSISYNHRELENPGCLCLCVVHVCSERPSPHLVSNTWGGGGGERRGCRLPEKPLSNDRVHPSSPHELNTPRPPPLPSQEIDIYILSVPFIYIWVALVQENECLQHFQGNKCPLLLLAWLSKN